MRINRGLSTEFLLQLKGLANRLNPVTRQRYRPITDNPSGGIHRHNEPILNQQPTNPTTEYMSIVSLSFYPLLTFFMLIELGIYVKHFDSK